MQNNGSTNCGDTIVHIFRTIAGTKFDGCAPVPVHTKDGVYRTAINIAKAAIPSIRIVLFMQEDNKLTLIQPHDIITEPTEFVVVNINDKNLELCAKEGLIDIAKWLLAYGHKLNNKIT